jgi:hypothetical protein
MFVIVLGRLRRRFVSIWGGFEFRYRFECRGRFGKLFGGGFLRFGCDCRLEGWRSGLVRWCKFMRKGSRFDSGRSRFVCGCRGSRLVDRLKRGDMGRELVSSGSWLEVRCDGDRESGSGDDRNTRNRFERCASRREGSRAGNGRERSRISCRRKRTRVGNWRGGPWNGYGRDRSWVGNRGDRAEVGYRRHRT